MRPVRRPFGLRLLVLESGVLALRGWGRIWVAIAQIDRYHSLSNAPPLSLYVMLNSVWGLVFTLAGIGFWRRQVWVIKWFWWLLLINIGYEMAWLAVVAASPYDRARAPFWLTIATVGLLINYWLIHRRNFRAAFWTLSSDDNDTGGHSV